MRAEQTESFFGCMSCNCSAAELAALSQSLVGWSTLRPRLTRHPASPRPHAANEENAALRKAIKDADYECGVGLLRLNQLDLVTVSPCRRPSEEAQLCLHHRSNSSRNLDLLNAFASPLQVAKRSNCAFSTVEHLPWTTTRWR